MKKQRLRVGFDLDGVLLYNPARIFRPVVVLLKSLFIPKEKNKFHLPKNRVQKLIWLFLHKSSFMTAPGLSEIKKLVIEKKIEAFIVSGRYDSLKGDFNHWLEKIDAKKYFSGHYYNSQDEQPHLYKEHMIQKLKLDFFVEDNWDIVTHLKSKPDTKILWIYNIFDRSIQYPYKFPSLTKVALYLKSHAK